MATITLPNNWRPRQDQLKLWSYLEDGGRHAEVVAHRRWGKDDVALHSAATHAFERVGNQWHMLPEYAQARKAIWEAVNPRTGRRRIDEAFPEEIRKRTNNQEMLIEFVNGGTWQVVGSDSYDKLVGTTPISITYSEWGLANPAARAYFRPIIAENNGRQIFITTPRGRNHAYRTFRAAQCDKEAFAQLITAYESPVFTPEKLEAERLAYVSEFGEEFGMAMFEQEYLCSFDAANIGAVLGRSITKAEAEGRVGDHVEYWPAGPGINVSVDIGRRDTAVFWFWQARVGGFALIDCIYGWGTDADAWVEEVNKSLSGMKLEKIWLPHDARNKTFSAKHSALEIFLKAFGSGNVALIPKTAKSDQINAARKVVDRCEFSSNCADGLEELRQWSYEWNNDTKMMSKEPKHDGASHFGDAFAYGCQVMGQHVLPKAKEDTSIQPIIVVGGESNLTLEEIWQKTPTNNQTRI